MSRWACPKGQRRKKEKRKNKKTMPAYEKRIGRNPKAEQSDVRRLTGRSFCSELIVETRFGGKTKEKKKERERKKTTTTTRRRMDKNKNKGELR